MLEKGGFHAVNLKTLQNHVFIPFVNLKMLQKHVLYFLI